MKTSLFLHRSSRTAGFLCGLLTGGSLLAQTYDWFWHTLDGGGGTSTGGIYSASFTIGQPDTRTLSGGPYTATCGFWSSANPLPPAVSGRFVFYNQSAFDGNDVSANAADDGAIATDKAPLLPGGVATFANYTSFSHGLNGLMASTSARRSTASTWTITDRRRWGTAAALAARA